MREQWLLRLSSAGALSRGRCRIRLYEADRDPTLGPKCASERGVSESGASHSMGGTRRSRENPASSPQPPHREIEYTTYMGRRMRM